jgi:N-acetyl-anhydromuramyl-L-alanine amidase AmpD
MKKLDIQEIKQVRLKSNQYFEESSPKSQIYLHHTAGNGNAEGVSRYWNGNDSRIATAFIIGENGTIVQCFSSKHWAWHLGIDQEDFVRNGAKYSNLNKLSVGIEVCNWGYLKKKGDKYYNYAGGIVNPSYVTELDQPFKGYKYWYKYSDAQIESLRQLVIYLCDTYNISKEYNESIWDIDKNAFKGINGIFTHNSVRKDKSDMYPCPRVIEMLKNL